MSFENLILHSGELIQYMWDNGYSKNYILLLKTEINWLKKNGDFINSYESACHIREEHTASYKRIKIYASMANAACKDVPLNAHAHLFRHGKASHWIEDGLSVVEIQFLLGHEQIETTMKYLDITTDQKVKALATLESETDKKISRKWKKSDGSLTDFCGLKR